MWSIVWGAFPYSIYSRMPLQPASPVVNPFIPTTTLDPEHLASLDAPVGLSPAVEPQSHRETESGSKVIQNWTQIG